MEGSVAWGKLSGSARGIFILTCRSGRQIQLGSCGLQCGGSAAWLHRREHRIHCATFFVSSFRLWCSLIYNRCHWFCPWTSFAFSWRLCPFEWPVPAKRLECRFASRVQRPYDAVKHRQFGMGLLVVAFARTWYWTFWSSSLLRHVKTRAQAPFRSGSVGSKEKNAFAFNRGKCNAKLAHLWTLLNLYRGASTYVENLLIGEDIRLKVGHVESENGTWENVRNFPHLCSFQWGTVKATISAVLRFVYERGSKIMKYLGNEEDGLQDIRSGSFVLDEHQLDVCLVSLFRCLVPLPQTYTAPGSAISVGVPTDEIQRVSSPSRKKSFKTFLNLWLSIVKHLRCVLVYWVNVVFAIHCVHELFMY